MKDIFENYLNNKENDKNKDIALTSRSYKNIDHSLNDEEINDKFLATYGDALLKLALCKILYEEKVEKITEEKKKYECDEVLVSFVAKNYDLLSYIKYDDKDEKIPKDYDYKNESYKYIATAVEALLAAFYLENKENFSSVVELVRKWKELIDKQNP